MTPQESYAMNLISLCIGENVRQLSKVTGNMMHDEQRLKEVMTSLEQLRVNVVKLVEVPAQ